MYVFLDESGVHKKEGRSSIALVYLEVEKLDALQKAVISTEDTIGINCFHWSHSTWQTREKFINEICKQEFSVKIALIKNPFYESHGYEYALQHLMIEKNIKTLVIDGKKSKTYERRLKKVLRDKGISTSKIKTAHDENYPALRVADAVAGIARYKSENPNDPRILNLYQRISKKILITLQE